MSDALDRLSCLPRERKSSEYLYDIPACHFMNMSYKGALKEKIRLAKILRAKLNILIGDELLPTEPDCSEEYSEYQKAEMRLYSVEKAIEFNEFLLSELKCCKDV